MSTSYRIDVIGRTWQGFQGSYSKPFPGDFPIMRPEDQIAARQWLKPFFGDFQSIEDFRVTRLEYSFERQGNKSVSVHTEEIVRDWHSEENEMAFEEMNR